MRPLRLLPGLLLVLAVAPLRADELLPPDRPVEQAIDHYIDERLKAENVAPAPQADDATLARRLTLDLAGRVPTAAEARAYVESTDPDKREKLVERLMASPGFVRHQVNEFDVLLTGGTRGSLREYLARAFGEARPWDRIFRELLLPDPDDPERRGAEAFLKERLRDADRMTNDVSALFFGVNVSCAQCHDHPLVEDWRQEHFFGMKAFLARTFDNGGFVAERGHGEVRFKTAGGEEKLAPMMFLTGRKVEDPAATRKPGKDEERKERERFEKFKKEKKQPPPPQFSARAKLVELALGPGGSDFFARAIVNRLWFRFFGRGLVMPLDQMHSANPPSHPELLSWLARDLQAHGYDLRRLIRGMVMSRAYSRGSRYDSLDVPLPSLFAVAQVRPLTPVQLATSLKVATANPEQLAGLTPEEFEKRLEALENGARGFAKFIGQPGEDFEVGAEESLLFSNGDAFHREFLADGGDRLLGKLKEVKDDRERIGALVWNVYSRPPTEEEYRLLGEYIARRGDRRGAACRQALWALLTSPEFRFNH